VIKQIANKLKGEWSLYTRLMSDACKTIKLVHSCFNNNKEKATAIWTCGDDLHGSHLW
jgi:hypothetical protein